MKYCVWRGQWWHCFKLWGVAFPRYFVGVLRLSEPDDFPPPPRSQKDPGARP